MIVDYYSIEMKDLNNLAKASTEAIAEGWQLHGGIQLVQRKSYVPFSDRKVPYFVYIQFFVRFTMPAQKAEEAPEKKSAGAKQTRKISREMRSGKK